MCVIVVAIFYAFNKWRVEGSLKLFSLTGITLKRLLSLDLLKDILHRCGLHMVKHSMLANIFATSGRWGHMSVDIAGHGGLDWQ